MSSLYMLQQDRDQGITPRRQDNEKHWQLRFFEEHYQHLQGSRLVDNACNGACASMWCSRAPSTGMPGVPPGNQGARTALSSSACMARTMCGHPAPSPLDSRRCKKGMDYEAEGVQPWSIKELVECPRSSRT